MMYQLVIRRGARGDFWAFYSDISKPPVWDWESPFVRARTVKQVIKDAKAIAPTDGPVMCTYLDVQPYTP